MRQLMIIAVVLGTPLLVSRHAAAQQAPPIKILRFTDGIKSMWSKHGFGGQFKALTGVGTPGGLFGYKTIGGPKSWGYDLLHGPGSHVNRQAAFKQQAMVQQQLVEQMREAQARSAAAGRTNPNGLRTDADRRSGQFAYEPPHAGSPADFRHPRFLLIRISRQHVVRSLGDGPMGEALAPPPM